MLRRKEKWQRFYVKRIKEKARYLRKHGYSLGEISLRMDIPKNTLSGWVKDIILNQKQQERIRKIIVESAAIGRPLALKVNREKIEKWKSGTQEKVKHYRRLVIQNPEIGKLVCGIMYLCEGAKYPASRYLYLGNSDQKIISFFLNSLRKYYDIKEDKLRFAILYRWDQNYEDLKRYWSEITGIAKSQCLKSKPDIRTEGKPTLKKDYKGVCRVIYYDTSLQFELQSIGEAIINGAGGDRTLCLFHAMEALSQVSYGPKLATAKNYP